MGKKARMRIHARSKFMYDALVTSYLARARSGQAGAVQFGAGTPRMTPTGNSGVRFVRKDNAAAVGKEAAVMIANQLAWQPDSTFIFPTGGTPLPMYESLRHRPELNWKKARLFHLDEYVPPQGYTGPTRYETYEEYMRRELWDYLDADRHFFKHSANDPVGYEREINKTGGPDVVVLGIGVNGHVAFNEPGADPHSPARTIEMADSTILRNFKLPNPPRKADGTLDRDALHRMGYPTDAVTVGLDTILRAKKIVLLATGADKQAIVKQAFDPKTPPDPQLPASWLKTHPDVTVITDFPAND